VSDLSSTIILAGSLLLQLGTLCFQSHAAPGDVDLSFDPGSGVNGTVNAVAVQPDGKVIIRDSSPRSKASCAQTSPGSMPMAAATAVHYGRRSAW